MEKPRDAKRLQDDSTILSSTEGCVSQSYINGNFEQFNFVVLMFLVNVAPIILLKNCCVNIRTCIYLWNIYFSIIGRILKLLLRFSNFVSMSILSFVSLSQSSKVYTITFHALLISFSSYPGILLLPLGLNSYIGRGRESSRAVL